MHLFKTRRDLYILPLCVFFNILLVMLLFSLCRLIFLAENLRLFPDLTPEGVSVIFRAGLIFDISAVLYTNLLYIALALFPQPWKESRGYQKVLKWVFVLTNSVALLANFVDVVYFPFTNKRITSSFFMEFAGEGNLSLSHIAWAEVCNHWYVFTAFFITVLILISCYFKPGSAIWRNNAFKGLRPLPVTNLRYHLTHFIILAAVAYPIVAGLRGGFDRQTRPIAVSNANRYVHTPKEAAIVLNTPFAIYRTLGSDTFPEVRYFSDCERHLMESLFSPLHKPDTACFRPLNVVVFIMESFGREYSGYLNPDIPGYEGYMPFLDSLMRCGLTYRYSFANGHQSIDAMPSILSGIPRFGEPFFLTSYSLNDITGIGGELASKGYYTAFFHGAKNGSMGFEAYSKSAGYKDYYGRNEYREWLGHSDSDDYDGYWGIWDEPFLQFFADRMNTFSEPFCTGIFTASSHHPFVIPGKYEEVFPKGTLPIHRCIGYSDNALRKFFGKASQYDWYDRTLFVITGDHTNETSLPGYQTDAGIFGVPVIFYYPGGVADSTSALPNELNEQSIAQQCDIMPTVLGFLGYDSPFVAFGCNLLTTPPEETFAINQNNGIYQFFKGDYLLQFDGNRTIGMYRFREDVLLHDNIAGKQPEIRKRMEDETRSIIQQYVERMRNNQLTVK